MTEDELTAIEARAGAVDEHLVQGCFAVDTGTVGLVLDDAMALVAEVRRLQEAIGPTMAIVDAFAFDRLVKRAEASEAECARLRTALADRHCPTCELVVMAEEPGARCDCGLARVLNGARQIG